MKANQKQKLILMTCALAMISPLFVGKEVSSSKVSENETHLVSSLYRSISSVEPEENKKEKELKSKEGEASASEEAKAKQKEEDMQTLCENKKKIADLDAEIEKLEKEKDKVNEIIAKLDDSDDNEDEKDKKKDSKKQIMSAEVLSQLLMQQIYLNRMLTTSMSGYSSYQVQRPVFEQPKIIMGSNSGDMPSNYASMALYNQLALKLNSRQMWSPQFNQQGNLTNSLYGSTNPMNPYNHNYVFAADQSVYGNLL